MSETLSEEGMDPFATVCSSMHRNAAWIGLPYGQESWSLGSLPLGS